MKYEWNGNEYVNDMKLNRKWFLYNWNGIEITLKNDNENEMTTN